jgi:ketosteroid isomerase-like protein
MRLDRAVDTDAPGRARAHSLTTPNTLIRRAAETDIATTTKRVFAATLVAGCCVMVGACAGIGQSTADVINKQDESQILAALQASVEAWNRGDLKGHLAIYDPSVTVMTKTGPRPTVEAIEAAFGQAYFVNGKPKQSLRMESVKVRSLSEQSALVTGRFVLSGGTKPEQSGWFTLVWLRKPTGWRAVHDHTS